jgi:hypothetical protein
MGLDADERILAEDDLYVIRAERRVVWVHVRVPRNVEPSRGAAAAQASRLPARDGPETPLELARRGARHA